MKVLTYLMRELGLKAVEWSGLSDAEKNTLREYAAEEMRTLGIPILI